MTDPSGHAGSPAPEPPPTSPPPSSIYRRASALERAVAGVLALLALSFLILGAGLNPDPDGYGTHTQLGMPACGWLAASGKPCPTCGMTTAVALGCEGRFLASFSTQPAGALVPLLASVLLWTAGYTAWTGSSLLRIVSRGAGRPALVWAALGALALAWAYKLALWAPPGV
ncbi:MAG: DUF2752 domain-containing protein [Phycisphaeraceae bacterium]|nr:MAG: DUF2752 domain-containing protein [Phycisphaeraceae bacterium]